MTKKLPLYLGDSIIGAVTCNFDGVRAVFDAVSTENLPQLTRAYIRTGGTPLLIGVLAPDGGLFTASKTVSKTALASLGINIEDISLAYTMVSGGKKNAPSERLSWSAPPAVTDEMSDDRVIRALLKSGGALVDDAKSPSKLAVPLMTGRPFPRPDTLCLMTPADIDGTLYAVLGISKNGAPRQI